MKLSAGWQRKIKRSTGQNHSGNYCSELVTVIEKHRGTKLAELAGCFERVNPTSVWQNAVLRYDQRVEINMMPKTSANRSTVFAVGLVASRS